MMVSRKSLAFLTALMTFFALVVPLLAAQPAQANHGARTLEVTPETDTNTVNTGHTLTATISAATADAINIDFEIDSGQNGQGVSSNTNQGDSAFTPDSPDMTCTIPGDSATTTCTVTYTSTRATDLGSPDLITAWIDHDGLDGGQPGGFTELDPTEGRDEGATPGTTAEPDITDVVQKHWTATGNVSLDCDDQSGNDTETNALGQNEVYDCTVTDEFGNPQQFQRNVDMENLNGPNDPDNDGTGPGTSDADCQYVTFGAPCQITVSGAENQSGTATICFWVDNGGSFGDDVFDITGASDDGGDCGEAVLAPEFDDDTDTVSKTWLQAPTRLNIFDAAGSDQNGTAETETNQVNTTHTYTAQLLDNSGVPTQANVATQVDAEILAGGDGAQSAQQANVADFGCTVTVGNTTCDFNVPSNGTNGTDLICAWLDADGDSTFPGQNTNEDGNRCTTEGPPAGGEVSPAPVGDAADDTDDETDIAQKTWQGAAGPAVRLDCEPETDANQTGTSHIITCTAYDASAVPADGVNIDAEATGANDPDGANPQAAPDFTCTTGDGTSTGPGNCRITHGPPTANTGTTTYRAWIDADNNNATVEADATEGRNECTTPGSTVEGVPCPAVNGNAGDNTDVVEKTWSGLATALVLTPETDSAALGVCNPFTVTLTDGGGNPVSGAVIDIRQTHDTFGTATTPKGDPGFCTPVAADGPNPVATTENDDGSTDGRSGGQTNAGTDGSGQLTFGVDMDNLIEGNVTVLAFCEAGVCANATADDTPQPAELQDQSTKTWTAGGGDSVENVDAEPETASNPNGSTHTFTVTMTNAASNPIQGVTPVFRVTAGPNAGVNTNVGGSPAGTAPSCTVSTNAGVSTCQYTDPTPPGGLDTPPGTDTIEVWVQQSAAAGGGTAGRDAGEPFDQISKTWTPPPTGLRIDLTCDDAVNSGDRDAGVAGPLAGIESNVDCRNPLTAQSETFTAIVNNPQGTATTADDTPAAGISVTFNITAERQGNAPGVPLIGADATAIGFVPPGGGSNGPVTCTTAANGTCSVTVTNTDPDNGEQVDVTANVSGQTDAGTFGNNSDRATKSWELAGAANLRIVPQGDTNQSATSHSFSVLVTDQFGNPAPGVNVDADVSGRNTATLNDQTTNASGEATFSYNDAGTANSAGTDTILACADIVTENDACDGGEPRDDAYKEWVVTVPAVATVKLDMDMNDLLNHVDNPAVRGDTNDDCPDAFGGAFEDNAVGSNTVGTTHEVCALSFDANNNPIIGGSFTFTLTGPGFFTNAAGANLGTSVTVGADEEGHAHAAISSATAGTTTVTVTVGGQSDSGQKTWQGLNPRTIDCEPETGTNEADEDHVVTCEILDRNGNPVANATAFGQEVGAGQWETQGTLSCDPLITGDPNTCIFTADTSGVITATLENPQQQTGDNSMTFELAGGNNPPGGGRASQNAALDECERPADNPAGAPAGVCTDTVAKTFVPPTTDTECSDGVDNDGDGLIDFPDDPGCDSATDDDETDDVIQPTGPCQGFPQDSSTPDPSISGRVIVGTPGADILNGTGGDDIICGLAGNDIITGGGGDDLIVGNGGADTIQGGGGKDTINGGGGDDAIDGNRKNDVIRGGGGDDTLRGNRGNDTLRGGGGRDTLAGGKGDDILRGGSGNDTLKGFTGDDVLNGGSGNDTCKPGKGNDTVTNCEN